MQLKTIALSGSVAHVAPRRPVARRDRWLSLDELAREVAATEAAGNGGGDAAEALSGVRTALHHVHLPTLDAHGLVSYDPDRHRIRPRSLDAVRPYLSDFERR
ncbi:MAG: hypothetical protein ABEJ70_04385 [Halobacteriaceae archaeon]